uniref:carbonic anhydrase n=1 Tax=viral metagenome TaxID=1070528 RepID=A0A6C0EC45_9ZZZZ
MSNWSYGTSTKWENNYPQCSSKNNNIQSPINIITNNIKSECASKCQLTIKYRPSKCYLTNDHNTITIKYDPGSYIIYQNNWYELSHAKIHVPSLHAVDGEHFRAEIDLYHCTDRQCDSGVVLAIFLEIGPDYGSSVEFLSQFINQAPTNDTFIEKEISVSPDWNIVSLIPEDRTCVVYEGSLPHPPCSTGWTWIIFNHPTNAGTTILKTLNHNIVVKLGENIRRPIPQMDDRIIYRIPGDWVKVFEEKPKNKKVKLDQEQTKSIVGTPSWKNKDNLETPSSLQSSYWSQLFQQYQEKIKGILVFITLILFIILSIQITKYIIRNDILNNYFVTKGVNDTGPRTNANGNLTNGGNINGNTGVNPIVNTGANPGANPRVNNGGNTGVNTSGNTRVNNSGNTGVNTSVNTGGNTRVNTGSNTGGNTRVNNGGNTRVNNGGNTGVTSNVIKNNNVPK